MLETDTVLAAQETTDADAGDVSTEAPAENDATVDATPEAEAEATAESTEGDAVEYGEFETPEGIELDAALLDEAKPLFQDLKLSQDQAQKLVSFFSDYQLKMAESQGALQKEVAENWTSEIKTEWGNQFDANVEIAKKAVAYAGEGFSKMLLETGMGNNPEMIKFMHRVGASLSEDAMDGKSAPIRTEKSLEEKLYPSMART